LKKRKLLATPPTNTVDSIGFSFDKQERLGLLTQLLLCRR
jgi:hypothetical protein